LGNDGDSDEGEQSDQRRTRKREHGPTEVLRDCRHRDGLTVAAQQMPQMPANMPGEGTAKVTHRGQAGRA
jgi:hypothetical protein